MTEIERIELLFFEVLADLKDYLGDLTLVGGWMPYVYSKFLWNNFVVKPVTTVDIDFGFSGETKIYPKTIFEMLSSLDYKERHIEMDKMYPVVLYKQGKIPIDFITSLDMENNIIEKLVGREININKIEKFDFLLKHRIPVKIKNKGVSYLTHCPKPSAFLYHKAMTFIDRETEQKKAKDLQYMYFILRYAPDINIILTEIAQYKKSEYSKDITINIDKYFKNKTSPGCLMVERENGPDDYLDDLRLDIFDRFKKFKKSL